MTPATTTATSTATGIETAKQIGVKAIKMNVPIVTAIEQNFSITQTQRQRRGDSSRYGLERRLRGLFRPDVKRNQLSGSTYHRHETSK